MTHEEIKTLINALNEKESSEISSIKLKYDKARQAIQDFCDHPELKQIMSDKECTTCDRLFWHEDNRIATYIKKDDSEWSQISDIIKESVESKGLTREDLEKIIKETEFKTRL